MPGFPAKFQAGDVAVADGFGGWTRTGPAALRTTLGLGSLATASAITASLISDATIAGRGLLTAVDATAQRTALALGSAHTPTFSGLILGTDPGGSETLRVGGTARIGSGGTQGYTTLLGDGIEIGIGQTADALSLIDFHSAEATYSNHSARLIRGAGANGAFTISQRGTGALQLQTVEAAPVEFLTSGLSRMSVLSGGSVTIGTDPGGGSLLRVGGSATFGNKISVNTAAASSSLTGNTVAQVITWLQSAFQ